MRKIRKPLEKAESRWRKRKAVEESRKPILVNRISYEENRILGEENLSFGEGKLDIREGFLDIYRDSLVWRFRFLNATGSMLRTDF